MAGEQKSTQRDATLSACACFNVRTAARAITDLYDRTLEPSGLRINQFAILASIFTSGGPTMQELAAGLDVDPSTMTRTLKPLETDGLVEIRSGSDRRAKELALTAKGKKKLAECHELWGDAQEALRSSVGGDRFDRLLADLGSVTRVLRPS
jgi:DNA-binding MarR family transcriptional regulator